MSQYLRLDPQPNILGSYVQDDDLFHYSESGDLDRLAGKPPKWLTLTCPFGIRGELVCLKGTWFWKGD